MVGLAIRANVATGIFAGAGGGTFAHGDDVTITGTGFGSTMPTFLFAGGATGILETTTTGQTPNGGTNADGSPSGSIGFNWTRFRGISDTDAVVINDGTRGKVIGKSSTYEECSQECKFSTGVGFSSKIMVKFWARYNCALGGPGDDQYKIADLMAGTSDISDNNGSNFKITWLLGQGMAYNVPSGGTGAETWYLPDTPDVDNQWQRFEQKIITPSAQNTSNGQMYYRITRNSVESYMSASGANASTQLQSGVNMYPNSLRYNAYAWQNWGGNGLTANGMGIDDHFVQVGSFACVELWNTNNPATATVREIQEPTAWADGSITVRLNKGGLPAGNYYLVVLADSVADTVLASLPITVS